MNLYPIEVNSDTSVTLEYDNYIIDASANNVTMTLPDMTGIGFGKSIIFSRVDQSNFTVTIVATATTIDGVASVIIPALGFRQIVYDNNDWHTIQGVGYSGYSGYSGISGYSGFSGISGYSGFSGLSGFSGNLANVAAVAHEWIDSVVAGVPHLSQPATTDLSDVVSWTDYSGTSTIVGWASFTTKILQYYKIGSLLFVQVNLIGASNSTSTTFTIPYTSNANTGSLQWLETMNTTDNGLVPSTGGFAEISASGTTVTVFKDFQRNAWTNSGLKGVQGFLVIAL